MARATSPRRKIIFTILAWIAASVIFFPILWIILMSFKTDSPHLTRPTWWPCHVTCFASCISSWGHMSSTNPCTPAFLSK